MAGLDRWLALGGTFVFEIGETQGPGVQQLLVGFDITVRIDLAGRDRFVVGRRSASPAEVIRQGGVVGVPTDTVYGLAVDPTSPDAVNRLYEMKSRPSEKPIALLVADIESASELVDIPAEAVEIAREHWPGALTLVTRPRWSFPPGWVTPRPGPSGSEFPIEPISWPCSPKPDHSP